MERRSEMLPRLQDEAALYEALLAVLSSSATATLNAGGWIPQFDAKLAARAKLRILITEDHLVNCKVIVQMLRGFGYEADMVHSGGDAVEAARKHAYDLVLMDIRMPGMDGLEATRRIIANAAGGQRPRIVAMSASVMKDDMDAAAAAGVDDYVAKPFTVEDLRSLLETTADLKRMQAPPDRHSLAVLV